MKILKPFQLLKLLLLSLIMSSCAQAEIAQSVPEIAQQWQLEKIVNTATGETTMATQGEFLSLESGETSNFTSSGNLFGISLAGTWQQSNNTIVLQQLPADFATPDDHSKLAPPLLS